MGSLSPHPPPIPISLLTPTPRLTCPILRSVVITKDIQGLSSPDCHLGQRSGQLPRPGIDGKLRHPHPHPGLPRYLGDIGHEVVGDTLRIFADAARGVGAYGVEVPKQHSVPGLRGTGPMVEPGSQSESQLHPRPSTSLCLACVLYQ